MTNHAATLDAPQSLEHFTDKGQSKLRVDLTDPNAQRVRYADNAAAQAALGDLTITGMDSKTAANHVEEKSSGRGSSHSEAGSASRTSESATASTKPEGSSSTSDSGSSKNEKPEPVCCYPNRDGSLTLVYPDKKEVTQYGPGDPRSEKTVSSDGNLTKTTYKDGKEIVDNKKTGETTISTPPGEHSPGSSVVIKDGKVVSRGPYKPVDVDSTMPEHTASTMPADASAKSEAGSTKPEHRASTNPVDASAKSEADSTKPEYRASTNPVDASAKSEAGSAQPEHRSTNSAEASSRSDSGSEKKDLTTLPINETHNSDGSTTKTYPDGRQETIYGPTDYRASKTVSPDGNETKVKFKDGMQVTDNKKTGETTATMPPGPNSPGYSTTMKGGQIVRRGEYRPE